MKFAIDGARRSPLGSAVYDCPLVLIRRAPSIANFMLHVLLTQPYGHAGPVKSEVSSNPKLQAADSGNERRVFS